MNSPELGRVTLNDDPLGWDTVKKVFTRNQKYLGVFRKRTTSIKFIGDGLAYCVELEKLRGTEAILNVIIMVKTDYEDAWELEYEGIGKFNPFNIMWEDNLSPVLTIEFEDSGFHVKFLARVDTMVNVGDETSAEGLDLGPMPVKSLQVQQRKVEENNTFKLAESTEYYGGAVLSPGEAIKSDVGHVIPAEKTIGDTDFITTPIDYALGVNDGSGGFDPVIPALICDFVTQPTAFTIKFKLNAAGRILRDVDSPFLNANSAGFYIRKYTDSTDPLTFTDITINEITSIPELASGDDYPISFAVDTVLSISLMPGEAFTIIFNTIYGDGSDYAPESAYELDYTVLEMVVTLIQNFDEYVSTCHYRYEFMKRLVQHATDQDDCFKSDIFGRTDIGYPSQGRWQNNVVFSGKQLRGFEDFPVWSYGKAFQSVRSIFNLGCGIEKFGSKFKIVLEDLTYFFRGEISITLHNVRGVARDVSDDHTFSEVRVGYEKAEYEQVNGLEEYNNKCVFTTFIKSKQNVLDLISEERADGYGMEFARRKHISIASTEDTSYDQEVFTAMVYEGDGSILRTQRDENYDSVDNIQSPETAVNLDITPQRNLLRNGDWVHACVIKFPLEFLQFRSSDKPTDLVSQRTGNVEVAEQTSVQNKDLLSPLWLNKLYLFEADVEPWQVTKMEKESRRLIKFSPFSREMTKKYYYGWIQEVTVGGKERAGDFTLLAANIASDRLKLVDPDGIYDGDPTTPLPPTGEEYGFQYSFEKAFEG